MKWDGDEKGRDMFLCQAAYFSTPEAIDEAVIRDILAKSEEKNARLHITGALSYNGQRFMQVLEGERAALSRLIIEIANDARHKNFTLLGFHPIDERLFSSWSMTYIAPDALSEYIVSRYSVNSTMMPEAMTYESVVGALRSLCS
ncbi:blue light sensor protein [Roseomonas genomospecies 6]|uniref:Blue light sensor protein n=2 Tax=Roseomonas genomospecies 6 TaxID=214106 RepID=A0A9W7NP93_9PROT|nr:blue light sensor protein [Roseomonas genomospecies 6]